MASSGCGPTAMATVLSNLCAPVTPPEMADFALASGARAAEGTDMARLAKVVCERWPLEYRTTNDVSDMAASVAGGCMAICNVAGDQPGRSGIFSSGGHYVVCVGNGNGVLLISDPAAYVGKFDFPHRWRKVVPLWEQLLCCAPETLDEDCMGRRPRYHIFKKK